MDRAATEETELTEAPTGTISAGRAQRAFSISMIVSGIRCALAYVILPFVTPFLGLAPAVGPGLGIVIGAVAIAANVYSMRRFWRLHHPWRKWISILHVGVIALLVLLMVLDALALVRQVA
ncbi:MAG: hypothetical protein ACRDU9_00980 [Acidimicrobiia bacterium]